MGMPIQLSLGNRSHGAHIGAGDAACDSRDFFYL